MNEERTLLWILQTEHTSGDLWQRYSVSIYNNPTTLYTHKINHQYTENQGREEIFVCMMLWNDYSIFLFPVVFCKLLFVNWFFALAIILSVLLRFTNPDYLFGVFKLFNGSKDEQTPITTVFINSRTRTRTFIGVQFISIWLQVCGFKDLVIIFAGVFNTSTNTETE